MMRNTCKSDLLRPDLLASASSPAAGEGEFLSSQHPPNWGSGSHPATAVLPQAPVQPASLSISTTGVTCTLTVPLRVLRALHLE